MELYKTVSLCSFWWAYLNSKEPNLFKDLYKEVIIRNPKKGGFFEIHLEQ